MAGPGDELEERVRELVRAAREAGRVDELPRLLDACLAQPRAARPPASNGGPPAPAKRFGMVGSSDAMAAVFALIDRAAPTGVPILVHGETGTGKELVARALHDRSGRKGRFLAENCAAVPANLLESELFGHTRGAFTGAVAQRDGHFVAADGGTLFLDEIGDMPLDMQAKLLRVLETGEVRPVGGNATRKVDVRAVAATHRDLAGMVAAGGFRQDLFYRLNVLTITLPPLRERREDIPELVRYFLGRVEGERPEIAEDALESLRAAAWPGNVRQLENELRRATALCGGRITRACLSPELGGR